MSDHIIVITSDSACMLTWSALQTYVLLCQWSSTMRKTIKHDS